MKINKIRFFSILVCLLCILGLTSCSCGATYPTQFSLENAEGKYVNVLEWVEAKFENVEKELENHIYLKKYLAEQKNVLFENFTSEEFELAKAELKGTLTDEEFKSECEKIIKNEYETIYSEAATSVTVEKTEEKYNEILSSKTEKEVRRMSEEEKKELKNKIEKDLIKEAYEKRINEFYSKLTESEKNAHIEKVKAKARDIIVSYPLYGAISGEKKEKKIQANFKTILIQEDVKVYTGYINAAKTANKEELYKLEDAFEGSTSLLTSCIGSKTTKIRSDYVSNIETEEDIYRIVAIFTFKVEERMLEQAPLKFYTGKEFWSHIFNNLLVYPVGWLLYAISKLCGGYYIIGLLLTTLIVRTLGWPIYAKTNDMSLKMKAIEPDLAKIQKKYEGKTDPDSQRMMQMEQARLYKENKVFGLGCLMPFLQFPIFMAVYRAIQQLPYTKPYATFKLDWALQLDSTVFGIDLFADKSVSTIQLIGILVLVVLVVGTQFISQKLSEKRQKEAQEAKESDIPEYRRQSYKQEQQSTQNQMQMMIYMMMLMMGLFVWQSKAGLGVYWLIGNLYSMFQTFVNNKMSIKKLERMKQRVKRY